MESLDYWHLCDELTVMQAALLLAGCDPSGEVGYVENWNMDVRPVGYEAAKAAISNALRRQAIAGRIVPHYEHDINGNICGEIEESIDIQKSRIEVESLQMWLRGRGLKSGFFVPPTAKSADYLAADNPCYAPKLAAAVE